MLYLVSQEEQGPLKYEQFVGCLVHGLWGEDRDYTDSPLLTRSLGTVLVSHDAVLGTPKYRRQQRLFCACWGLVPEEI